MLQWIISIMGSDYPIIKTSSERGRERESEREGERERERERERETYFITFLK